MFNELPQAQALNTNISVGGPVDKAIKAFQARKPVLIHDSDNREGEIDMVYPSLTVEPDDVARLRNDAGGLICVALSHEVAEAFDLPFLADELSHPASQNKEIDYDERSSFSLPVNHVDSFTGITDIDRSLTITRLGSAAIDPKTIEFSNEFHSPGHIHILRAAPNLLAEREGHTELGIALAKATGRAPAVVVCEMLDDETGQALSKKNARRYAFRHDLPYITGENIKNTL